ncbi:MAG TPA: hypothetical protein VK171_15350 [Fimbriimonas sp.]|nr:hypothetical protein [Fimbriimonas sp.]
MREKFPRWRSFLAKYGPANNAGSRRACIALAICFVLVAVPVYHLNVFSALAHQNYSLPDSVAQSLGKQKELWQPHIDNMVQMQRYEDLSAAIDVCLYNNKPEPLLYILNSGVSLRKIGLSRLYVYSCDASEAKDVALHELEKRGCW